jgi:hypothetical protein
MPTAAILGCAGYPGQETLDRVLAHPALELLALGSDSLAGKPAWCAAACAVDTEQPAAEIVADALERGLAIGSAGPHTIRLTPPLTLSADEADLAVSILHEVLG